MASKSEKKHNNGKGEKPSRPDPKRGQKSRDQAIMAGRRQKGILNFLLGGDPPIRARIDFIPDGQDGIVNALAEAPDHELADVDKMTPDRLVQAVEYEAQTAKLAEQNRGFLARLTPRG